jgi:5'-3' exonuclease
MASAAAVAEADRSVERVWICTPDKDLAQCVVGTRVVQLDRRAGKVIDEAGVVEKFGVPPASIPDWLALVGDSADGFPGLPGWGKRSAATVLSHYGHLAAVPDRVADWDPGLRRAVRGAANLAATLAEGRPAAELFLDLATLRVEPDRVGTVAGLRWPGPTPAMKEMARYLGEDRLAERAAELADRRS